MHFLLFILPLEAYIRFVLVQQDRSGILKILLTFVHLSIVSLISYKQLQTYIPTCCRLRLELEEEIITSVCFVDILSSENIE